MQTSHPITYFRAIETLETIKEIILNEKKGALLRFGDGDIALANGARSGSHEFSLELQKEMIETFGMNDPCILKTLPFLNYEFGGPEVEFFYGKNQLNEEKYNYVFQVAQPIWGAEIENVYSPLALAYTSVAMPTECIDFLKFLRSQNCELFIGNRATLRGNISLLFRSCQIVGTPSKCAYKEIDRIEQECLEKIPAQSTDYRVIIVSCGNTGRVLIKRLWPQLDNVFFFDFGSLMDALCGLKCRGWIKTTHFNARQFLTQFAKSLLTN